MSQKLDDELRKYAASVPEVERLTINYYPEAGKFSAQIWHKQHYAPAPITVTATTSHEALAKALHEANGTEVPPF